MGADPGTSVVMGLDLGDGNGSPAFIWKQPEVEWRDPNTGLVHREQAVSFSFDPGEQVYVGFDPATGESAVYDKNGNRKEPKQVRDGYCPLCSKVLLEDHHGQRACPDPACGYVSGFNALAIAAKKAKEAMEGLRDTLYETACEFCTPSKLVEANVHLTSVDDSRYLGEEVNGMKRARFEHAADCPIYLLGESRVRAKSVRTGIPIEPSHHGYPRP